MGQFFYFTHALTPIAIPHIRRSSGTGYTTFRVLCIFGFRVASWSTINWDTP